MIELLGHRADSALGIDRSPEMLRLARGRIEASGLPRAEVRRGDMYALPGANGSVDPVVLHQVLHFADDPSAVLQEAARLLAPGGRLMVVDFMPHKREELRERQRHVRLGFSDAQVIEWLTAAGLSGRVAAQLLPPTNDQRTLGVTLWLGTRDTNCQRKAA
jgi:ArsR family transcriptional regulator